MTGWRDEVLRAVEEELDRPEIIAELACLEAEEAYPETVIDRLRRVGLAELLAEGDAPSRVTMWHLCALNALTARRDASLAITIGVNALALLPAYLAAKPEQLDRIFRLVRDGASCSLLLSELDHGSNLLRNQARAERGRLAADGYFVCGEPATHYCLTGEKHLINGATRHQLLFTLMRTRPACSGSAMDSRGDFTLLWFERDGTVEPLPRYRTLPAAGADIAGIRFQGTCVPCSNVLGAEGDGFGIVQKTLLLSRGGIGALASGAATRAFDLSLAYARSRDVYGAPIVTLGAIQDHLMRIEAIDLLCAATSIRAAAAVNALGRGAAHFTAVAKYACCALAEMAVEEGRRVLGGRALLRGHPYERLVRDVLLYGVFDGTSHLMLDQLQWRLAQSAAGVACEGEGTIDRMSSLYRTPPRRLIDAERETHAALLLQPEAHARALASLPGQASLAPLVDLARGLLEVVRALRAAGRWDGDAGMRFEAGGLFGFLEALFDLVELTDADRRTSLNLARVEEPAYAFALGWWGGSIASRVRALSLRMGIPAPSALLASEEGFLAGVERERGALRSRLLQSIARTN